MRTEVQRWFVVVRSNGEGGEWYDTAVKASQPHLAREIWQQKVELSKRFWADDRKEYMTGSYEHPSTIASMPFVRVACLEVKEVKW